jgi:hypothetical protein
MEMPGRKWTASNYRYSHNGHEKEEEIFSGAQSAEFWMYDSRIGRRWELDPVLKPWESPYATFNNNPILFSDPSGLEGEDETKPAPGGNTPRTKENRELAKGHYDDSKVKETGFDGTNDWRSYQEGDATYVKTTHRKDGTTNYYTFPTPKNSEDVGGGGKTSSDDFDKTGSNGTDKEELKAPPPTKEKNPPPTGGDKEPPPIIRRPPRNGGGGLPPPNIILPNTQPPPCNPINQTFDFKWVRKKSIPENPFDAIAKMSLIFKQWQPCHSSLVILVTTDSHFAGRNDPDKTLDGGTLNNLLILRFNYIRKIAIDNGIPSNKIFQNNNRNIMFDHTHDGKNKIIDAHISIQ